MRSDLVQSYRLETVRARIDRNDRSREDALCMDEVEELVQLARDLAEEVVGLAIELLSAGADIAHVQGRYVAVAVELLTDAEAQSLLAAGGDPDALAAQASIASELAGLRDRARAESSRSGER
jgi:hypothetical protein